MLVTMSDKEIHRLPVIQAVCEKRLRRRDAASQLGISERQAQRLINRYRVSGAEGLVSRKRGQPSNRRLTESLKLRVLTLIRENYSDFGPTLAAEKLRERHNIRLSIETVRNWMTSDGLWVPHARRKSRVYQPRHRRDCLGELIQIDGSHHDWFEGRIHDGSRSGIFLNERCKPAQDPSGRYRPPSYHTSCCNPTRLKISDRHC